MWLFTSQFQNMMSASPEPAMSQAQSNSRQGTFPTKGFTLIELLVVIAIIALLVSILVPSLQKARELARQTVCLSNLKTTFTGLGLYSNTYNGYFPGPCRWPLALVRGELVPKDSFKCPSATKLRSGPGDVLMYASIATKQEFDEGWAMPFDTGYLCNIKAGVSYGWNGWGLTRTLQEFYNALPQKSELFRSELIIMAENNTLRLEYTYILSRGLTDPTWPNPPSYTAINQRHEGQASILSLDGRAYVSRYADISDAAWGGKR